MISICLPTRGRPEFFKRMCLSVLDNASEPNDIEFVSYHDNDDPSTYEYFGNHKEVVGNRINHSQTFNQCYKIASGPIYMFAADDMVFYTKEWDKRVKEVFDQSADKIIFVYANNKYTRSSFGTVGFLYKNWIDAVGYFTPPYFAAWYTDRWINDVAAKINRRVFLRSVVIKEVGVDENTRQIEDKTYMEYMKRRHENNCKEIYLSKEVERERDAQLLQDFINSYRSGIGTLSYIVRKYNLDFKDISPIEIPNTDRIELAHLFKELGFKRGVEVGVGEGIYSEVLLQANPKLKLYGVDPYLSYETAGNFGKQEQLDAYYQTAVKRLTPYKKYTLVKKTSMKAVKDFKDKSLDFVYIDANHEYSYVHEDIAKWYKKIKKGGIISGYAYRRSKANDSKLQVVNAVNDYVRKYKIKHLLVLGRKQGIEGEKRDRYRSWFWVK